MFLFTDSTHIAPMQRPSFHHKIMTYGNVFQNLENKLKRKMCTMYVDFLQMCKIPVKYLICVLIFSYRYRVLQSFDKLEANLSDVVSL